MEVRYMGSTERTPKGTSKFHYVPSPNKPILMDSTSDL